MDINPEQNSLTHAEVQSSLSQANASRSAEESMQINHHLDHCKSCSDFAQMLNVLERADSVGYPKQVLSLKEKAEIVRQLDTKIEGVSRPMGQTRSLNLIGSAVVALVTILLVGAFILTMNRTNGLDSYIVNGPESESIEPVVLRQVIQEEFVVDTSGVGTGVQIDWVEVVKTDLQWGGKIDLQLGWQALKSIDAQYNAVAHLFDAEGNMVQSWDFEPMDGDPSIGSWEAGELLIDKQQLWLRNIPSSGEYTLTLGMYDAVGTDGRLQITGQRQIEIATIFIDEFIGCGDEDLKKITFDEFICLISQNVGTIMQNDTYLHRLHIDGFFVSIAQRGEIAVLDGGAVIFHRSSYSYLAFDFCGQHNPNLDLFNSDRGEELLLDLLDDAELMAKIESLTLDEWGSKCPEVSENSDPDLSVKESPDYDGWELGVAFDIPDVWSKSELVVEQLNGDGIVLAMGNEIYDLNQEFPPLLSPEETFGFVLVDNPGFKWAGSTFEQLDQFHKAGPGGSSVLTDIANRRVLVTENQIRDQASGIVIESVSGSLQIDGRFVRVTIFGRFEDETGQTELTRLLNEIVASTKPVDYTGWQKWKHSQEGFNLAYPEQLKLSDLNDDTLRLEEQEPSGVFRYLIDYDQNVVGGNTLSEALDSLLVDFEDPRLVGERWSPAHRTDLLLGRYELPQAEGVSVLAAVLENPADNSEQPYIATWLLVNDSDLDIYQPQFEAIIRSIRWQDVPLFPSFLARGENTQKTRRTVIEEFTLSDSTIGSGLKLYWVDWDRRIVRPGDLIELGFEWQTIKSMDRDYNLFVHLLNDEGEPVAQLDSIPNVNFKPTRVWALWEVVVGQHQLLIPDDLPAGEYSMIMGHYEIESFERLQIGGADHLVLDTISVVHRDTKSSEIEGIAPIEDIGMEFSNITFNDHETLIEFDVTGPELNLPTYQNQEEPFYQFGFPTTLFSANGLELDVLEISVLGTEGINRTQILKFPPISDLDQPGSFKLTANYMYRNFPADRFITIDWNDLADGSELTLNETVLINNIPVKIETLKWLPAEETVQIQLAPEHDLDKYFLISVWATAIGDEQQFGTSAGSVGPDLWDFGQGKIVVNLLLSDQPETEFKLYFSGDIQYLERYEFIVDP